MYQEQVTDKNKALIHLFLHCCMKDKDFSADEVRTVSDMIVETGLHDQHNLTDEVKHYKEYASAIKDETVYLDFLIRLIKPRNRLALLSFCIELFVSDRQVTLSEEVLISKIAALLYVGRPEQETLETLITQLNEVRRNKTF